MILKKFINNTTPEGGSPSGEPFGFEDLDKPIPETYKVGRDAQLQLAKVERDLFTDMEEKASGNYIVSGLNRQISELDFTAFSFAIGQILYNQSYQSGNVEKNSGLRQTEAESVSRQVGETVYSGYIATSLNDLCRLAYGVENPDTKQKKKMATIIDILDSTPVVIQYPNGSYDKNWLCRKAREAFTAENGAIYYNFYLNPIFSSNVKKNFGELPQDILRRLSGATSKKTQAHYLLIRLLSLQAKGKVFTRSIDTLLKDLNLGEAYKKKRVRTEKQILSLLDTMVNIGIIEKYEMEYKKIRNKQSITKVTFYLSPREKLIGKKNAQENN